MFRTACRFLASLLFLALTLPALAQGETRVELHDLQLDTFPLISLYMDVYDAGGAFVTGLDRGDINLIEDDKRISLEDLEELAPGVQFVAAINAGASFAVRDEEAISRFEKIKLTLQNWAESLPQVGSDDLSLITNGGTDVWHTQNRQEWLTGLSAYQPDLLNITPTLDVLSRAIITAGDPLPQAGMKRAVLFITTLPTVEETAVLYNLATRAVELKIPVFAWIVDSTTSITNAVNPIEDLVLATGGKSFYFSGEEAPPGPEEYLSVMRHSYLLQFNSDIRSSGSHTVVVHVQRESGDAGSSPLDFEMNVLPPNPIMITPPVQIVRQNPEEQPYDISAMVPVEQVIEIMVEFPDGHNRPISRTSLYVDGQIKAENVSEPFDRFTWDLSDYLTSGQHTLQVAVVDGLGLENTSATITVQVSVIPPERGLLPFLKQYSTWFTVGVVIAAGGVLTWVLVAAGKRHSRMRVVPQSREMQKDPLTQSVVMGGAKPAARMNWLRRAGAAPAYLVRWKGKDKPVTSPPIPLAEGEVSFGSDPTRVTHMLSDPSISPIHASIFMTPEGGFLIKDHGSVAGTWVNFERIPESGYTLKNGDQVNLGQSVYRFMLRKPPEKEKPRITPLDIKKRFNEKE